MRRAVLGLALCRCVRGLNFFGGFDESDSDDFFAPRRGPAAAGPQTGLDVWMKEVMDEIDAKYMKAEGLTPDGDLDDPTNAVNLELTAEAKDAARMTVKDLQYGFTAAGLSEAARDPYYFIDRTMLTHASAPVVDPGLWKALIDGYYQLKKFYLDFIQEFGTRSRIVPDRLLLLKLTAAPTRCAALQSGGDTPPARWDERPTAAPAETEPWEERYLKSNAKALAKALPMAMAARWAYVRNPATEVMRHGRELYFGDSSRNSFRFEKNPTQIYRHSSAAVTGHPRLMHLGSLTFFSVLDRALYMQDQIHPYHEEMGKLYHLFSPATVDVAADRSGTVAVWRPSNAVEKALVLLARCLGQVV